MLLTSRARSHPSIPNPKRPIRQTGPVYPYSSDTLVEGASVERWGEKFKWTSGHYTPQQLEPFIHSYDTVAAEAVERLDEIVPPPYGQSPPKDGNIEGAINPDGEKKPRRDLYKLVQKYAAQDEKVQRLWNEVNTVPEWVNWEQIERGQKVFFRYGGPAIITVSLETPYLCEAVYIHIHTNGIR